MKMLVNEQPRHSDKPLVATIRDPWFVVINGIGFFGATAEEAMQTACWWLEAHELRMPITVTAYNSRTHHKRVEWTRTVMKEF